MATPKGHQPQHGTDMAMVGSRKNLGSYRPQGKTSAAGMKGKTPSLKRMK